jgi:hypothetical protein
LYVWEHWTKYEKFCFICRFWRPPTCPQFGDFCLLSCAKDGKPLTHTEQPLSRTSFENAEKTKKTEAEQVSCDILAVCDSLYNLHEKLNRLAYVLQRKSIEIRKDKNGGIKTPTKYQAW